MFPHPNKLPRWLFWLLLLSGSALLLSGGGWLLAHWGYGAGSEELALPHPAEHRLIQAHGLAALLFTLALGGLGPVHLPRGWRQQRNHRSGLALVGAALLLLLSGYALYYWVDEAIRPAIGWLHSGIGLAMAIVLLVHRQLTSRTTH